ncbi:cell wall-binding repeat-containing protein [Clostridium sp. PL3]|uniref:Cell wall-binding repeat-containing protein n=1 Tax=Clostridium thailandense TaxID=2794346 RepID=A0A949X2W1_9CLOT|nr:cell wall-binding repeat-containing protein [Clostridium thailandense]MBV7271743.1 cell wall-binding repeat-containing protein [Clostridium thailandense]
MRVLKLLNYKIIFASMFILSIIFLNTKVLAEDMNASKTSIQRIEGSNRIETANLISKYKWKDTSENVVIASSEDFFCAISAVPLASKLNCPILFTEKNTLNQNTKEEIIRLKAKKIYIIGDKDVISQETEDELLKIANSVYRIQGKDKFSISTNIALIIGKSDKVFIVNGNDFPDALSIASIAGKNEAPIIFTDKEQLTTSAMKYIKSNKIKESYIVGGKEVISNDILNGLPNPYRLFGEDRYATNIDIINYFSDELNQSSTFIVPGESIEDSTAAIAAAVVAQSSSSPLVLMGAPGETYSKNFLESNSFNINNVIIIGGENVLSSKRLGILGDYNSINAKDYLDTVSYDGSNQGCHPKVLYFPDQWSGWKYWMVFTPYPNGDDKYENPSILVSQTGHEWFTPYGLVNPVVSGLNQSDCHLSDPHILFNQGNKTLELWYRATYYNNEDRIMRVTSKDGVKWSEPEKMVSFYGVKECLSPTVIFEDNKYKMWYVSEELKCMYIQSGDGKHWTSPKEVKLNLTDSYVPWHLDLIKTDLSYEILVSAFKLKEAALNNRVLMWGTSEDGLNFNNLTTVLIPTQNDNSWDNKQIYRSSFVKVNGVYKVFYSAMNKKNQWHIGLSQGKSMKYLHGFAFKKHK